MRGVILSGGLGTRMGLFTRRCGNKHVIPVYNRPMVEFPISSFSQSGIDELAIVTSNHHAGDLCKLIGNGKEFGFKSVQYFVQIGEGGISDALSLVEPFCKNEKFAVMLGDNIFEMDISDAVNSFISSRYGCNIFLKEVKDPQRFGVAEINDRQEIIGIEEKPKMPKSNLAITGLYFFDKYAFEVCKTLKPSARNELEIVDVLKAYLNNKNMTYNYVDGFWTDSGQPDSCLYAANWVKENQESLKKNGRFKNYAFKLSDGTLGDYL